MLGESFELFKARIEENQATMRARAIRPSDPRKRDESLDYSHELFAPPYFLHNAMAAELEQIPQMAPQQT